MLAAREPERVSEPEGDPARNSSTPERERETARELLGEAAYHRLQRFLWRETDFDLDAYRGTYLARRIRGRLAATRTRGASYVERVMQDPEEHRTLLATLGVNVSGFFRDPVFWAFLENNALPSLVADRADASKPLRAASVGCACGEEPYSLAMTLAELTADKGLRFRVDAFDVDPDALEVARRARYPRDALSPVSEPGVARYFQEAGDNHLEVRPWLRKRVRVRRLDALTQRIPGGYDLVLCRNVMIYFDGTAKEELLRKLHASLAPDGLFALGQSEVLLGRTGRLMRTISPRNRVYRKVV